MRATHNRQTYYKMFNNLFKPSCINCKYFIPDNDDSKYGRCSLFQKKEGKINFLVNGINNQEYYYCSTSRDTNEMCGEEGKYYKKNIVKNGRIK